MIRTELRDSEGEKKRARKERVRATTCRRCGNKQQLRNGRGGQREERQMLGRNPGYGIRVKHQVLENSKLFPINDSVLKIVENASKICSFTSRVVFQVLISRDFCGWQWDGSTCI